MKTMIEAGDTLTVTVAAGSDAVDLSAGDGYLVGSVFGVAVNDAAIGASVTLKLSGVFDLAKTTSQAWAIGDKIYWDAATSKGTTTSGSNKLIGTAHAAAGSNATSGHVRLSGAFTI